MKKTEKVNYLFKSYIDKINTDLGSYNPTIVTYGSIVNNNLNSDFDVCIILNNYNTNIIETISNLTIEFHIDHNLKLDNEVPFSIKTIYSFEDIETVINTPPFKIVDNKYLLNGIKKTSDYLSSKEIKLRLLFNILTTPTKVIQGDSNKFNKLKNRAFDKLLLIELSYLNNSFTTIDTLINALNKNYFGNEIGKDYLGYCIEKDYIYDYLFSNISTRINKLIIDNKLLKINNELYKLDDNILYSSKERTLYG